MDEARDRVGRERTGALILTGTGDLLGGVETNLLLLLQGWHAVSPLVVVPSEGALTRAIRALGVPCETVPYYGWRLPNPVRHLQTLRALWQAARRHAAQVIYLNHHCMVEFAVRLARVARLPWVCHMRNVEDAPFMQAHRGQLRTAQVVIASSRAVKDTLLSWGVPDERIRLVYDGIEVETFANARPDPGTRAVLGFPEKTRLVGTVVRVREDKGVGDLVRAAAMVAARCPNVRFVVAGRDGDGGQSTRRFRQEATSLGLEGRLVFTGYVEELPPLLAALDVFVLPSWMEACPVSLMEAMAAGTPVVATSVGGIPEVVEDGVHGLLCVARDPEALAARIIASLDLGRQEREAMRTKAIERVRERFDVDGQARAIEGILWSASGRVLRLPGQV